MQKTLLNVLLTLLYFSGSAQNPGTLDTSFNSTGITTLQPGTLNDVVYGLAVQPDAKIVFCGVGRITASSGFTSDMIIGRLNANGTIDASFANNGYYNVASTGGSVFGYDVKLQIDGKIVVCGGYSNTAANPDFITVRLNPDGTPDTTYGNNNGISIIPVDAGEDYAYDLHIRNDGKIILAGSSKVPGFTYSRGVVMQLLDNGSIDTTFGTQGKTLVQLTSTSSETFRCMDVTPGGSIIAAGYSYQNNNENFFMTGFTENGILNTSFANNGTAFGGLMAYAYDIIVNGNSVFAGGKSSNSSGNDMAIICYDTLGIIKTTWANNGIASANYNAVDVCLGLVIQPDGSLLAGGTSGLAGPFADRNFFATRYTQSGMLDTNFGTNGYVTYSIGSAFDDANAIALQTDGKILLGGFAALGNNDMVIVRLLNDSSGVSTGIPSTISNRNKIKIYPSPLSGDLFYLSGDFYPNEQLTISIYKIRGELILNVVKNNATENEVTLPPTLSNGIYYVNVVSHLRTEAAPLIINR